MPPKNRMISIGAGQSLYWNLVTSGESPPHELATTGCDSLLAVDAPGFEWSPVDHKMVGWAGGGQVVTMDTTYTCTVEEPSDSNTVIPDAPMLWGTFGRWRYVPKYNVFVVVSSVTGNVFLYRHSAGTGTGGGGSPPVVVITSPSQDTIVRPDSIWVRFTVDAVADSQKVGLDTGSNRIIISRTNAGGTGKDTVDVYRDTIPPVVQITRPPNDTLYAANSATVVWKVDGVTQSTLNTESLASDGAHLIIRTATDSAGNVGRDTARVFRDMTPPVVVITSPAEGSYSNQFFVDVSWTIDGTPQAYDFERLSVEGNNFIVRTATDSAGNVGRDTVRVVRDRVIPLIALTSPHQSAVILDTAVDVQWSIDGIAQTPRHHRMDSSEANLIALGAIDSATNTDTLKVTYYAGVLVPNLIDKTYKQADSILAIKVLGKDTTWVDNDSVSTGNVFSQSPGAGDSLPYHHRVRYKISRGTDAKDLAPVSVSAKDMIVNPLSLEATGFVQLEVVNLGRAATTDSFRILLFEDKDKDLIFSPGVDLVLGAVIDSDSLPAGDTVVYDIPVSGQLTFNGNRITAWVDSGNHIAETNEANNYIHSMAQCRKLPLAVDYTPQLKWRWIDTISGERAYTSPVVGHLTDDNGDGKFDSKDVPEIVASVIHSLVALDGRNGHEIWRRAMVVFQGTTPAIGDIDGDGIPEVVAIEERSIPGFQRLLVLDRLGAKKDSSIWHHIGSFSFGLLESVSLSDLDGDGKAELLWGPNIFDRHGKLIFPGAFNPDLQPFHAADLDQDGFQELLGQATPPNSLNLNLSLLKFNEKAYSKQVAIITTSDVPSVVKIGGTPRIMLSNGTAGYRLYNLALDSMKIILDHHFPAHGPGNFSPDPFTDVGFYGKDSSLYRFELGPYAIDVGGTYTNYPWFTCLNIRDSSIVYRDFPQLVIPTSQPRGSVFDFADDGDPKLVVRLADSLFILDKAGNTLGKTNGIPGGRTVYDAGIVLADADNDGHVDIIAPAGATSSGILMYSNPTWSGARSIYNQKDYTVTNVNDDGTIPRFPSPSWVSYNTTGVQCTDGHYACVDMTASLPQFVRDSASHDSLYARIGNGGALALPEGIPVTLYANHLGAEKKVATQKSPKRLEAGEYYTFKYPFPDSLRGTFGFRLAADDSGNGKGGLDEIDEVNNSVVLNVLVKNRLPIVTAPGARYAEPATAFLDTIHATDPDGDAVTYRLASAPLGMSIDLHTGILSWTPPVDIKQTTVQIAVSDSFQATTLASLRVYVGNASNHRPHIVSVPDTNVFLNTIGFPATRVWRYAIVANDSDGEALEYDWECGNCESHSGIKPTLEGNRFSWIPFQPVWSPGDSLSMKVKVIDERGGIDSQSFVLRLSDPVSSGNHAPAFLTVPITSAVAGGLYSYQAKASDQDNHALSYFITSGPYGMTATGGLVQWVAPAVPGGSEDVVLTVSDGNGGSASQSWRISLAPDEVPPAVNISFSKNPVLPGHSVTATVNARDNVGVSTRSLALNGSSVTLTGDQYTFTPSTAGEYFFSASALDTTGNTGHGSAVLRVRTSADDTPPTISLSHSPSSPSAGATVTFTVTASDDMALDSSRLWVQVDGLNLPVIGGQAQYQALRPGTFLAKAAAFDVSGNSALASHSFTVGALTGDATDPTAQIFSPFEDSVVYSRIEVLGTANDAHLAYYTLSYREIGTPTWIEFYRSTLAVVADKLGDIDATTLVNGDYAIRLDVYDKAGHSSWDTTQVTVSGEKKIGNFSLAFQDLNIPMPGLDLTVTRGYDSRVKTKGDFGIGWKMGLRSATLHENRNQGADWTIELHAGLFPTYDLDPLKAHTVTVTLPGGRKQEFTAVPRFYSPFVPAFGTMTYVAKPGTYSSLEAQEVGSFIIAGGELYDVSSTLEEPFDPQVYKLTLLDGSYYVIDQDAGGVIESGDAHGNKVLWDSASISHPSGGEIDFDRDAEGRITGITDGAGRSVHYDYDVLGNLNKVVDPNGNTTLFRYGPDSYLIDIVDALGIRASRTEYDDAGRIVRQINAAGDTLQMNHDVDHNFEEVLDFTGHVTSYKYDLHGNIVRKEDDAGNRWHYAYDSEDNLLTTLQPDGTLKSSTYDSHGNELTSTDELGHTITRTYNELGKSLTVTDALGRTTSYAYDATGNLIRETGPDETELSERTYDAKGNVLTEKDALGHLTSHTYNGAGWLSTTTDALGHTRYIGYDAVGNAIREISLKGDTTRYGYDNAGNRVVEVGPYGDSVKIAYNAINKPLRRTDALGHATVSVYDNLGDKIADTAADGTVTLRTYDGQGNVRTLTDAAGRTTTMEYDFASRLIKTTFADDNFTLNTYDGVGRRISSTDARGNKTSYGYDNAGRNTSVTDALGRTTYFEYDEVGRKTAMVDALYHRTEYDYDAYDRLIQTTYPNGSTTHVGYDAIGRKVSETDQSGYITHFAYDSVGNLRAVINLYGDSTRYTYDANGNRLTQKDANGHTTSMDYDALNRMVSRTYPNGDQERWTYDANGAMLSHVKGTDSTSYMYDVLGRESSRHHFNSGHTMATTYTPDGKPETVTDYRGVTTFSYDDRGRLAGEGFPNGDSLENHYDPQGNRTSVVTPFGTTAYNYDALNRMASVVSPQSKTTTYHYDAVGNRDSVISPNGTTSGYQYDNLNRLTRLRHYKAGTILAHYAYTLNAAGIRTQVTEKDSSKAFYGYDSLYRLKTERRTGNHTDTMMYTYDPVGNRLTKAHRGVTTTYSYNNRDELLSEWDGTDSIRYSYDSAGRMLTKTEMGGTTHYRWRDEDRLDSLYGPGVSVKYQYDAEGRRVKDSTGSTVRQHLIDPLLPYGQVIAETDGSNSLVSEYIYGTDRVSSRRSGAVRYYLADGQGSTRLLTDSTGTATDSTVYTAFGENLFSSGSMPNDFKYVGEQLDPNSGFYYNRARWYDSRVGRFASVDPFRGRVGVPMSQHRYLYAEQSPINKSDPTGRIVDYNLNSTSAAAAINGILEAGVGAAQRIAGRSLWKWFLGRLVLGAAAATTLTGDSWDDAQQRAWQNEARKESPVRLQHYTTDVGHGAILRDGVIKPMSGRVYLTPDFYSDPNEATEKLATCDKREWAVSLKVYSGADKLAPITEVQPYPCSDGRRPGGGRETSTTNPIYFGIMRETIIWWPLTD
jgi:RHS repeat-associated protein